MCSWNKNFNRLVDDQVRNLLNHQSAHLTWPIQDLVTAVRSRSGLLSASRWNRGSINDVARLIRALQRMAGHRFLWKRPIWNWHPRQSLALRQQLVSLSSHLFTRFEVPAFVHNVWLHEPGPVQRRDTKLLLDLGRSAPIKNIGLPIRMTKSVSKFFFVARDHFSINQAIRWAQCRAEGASDALANYLIKIMPDLVNLADANTVLNQDPGNINSQEGFWLDAIRFVVREFKSRPMEEVYHQDLFQLLKFAKQLKLEPADQLVQYRELRPRPLYPEFTFKGRTFRSLRRLKNDWPRVFAKRIQEILDARGEFLETKHAWPAANFGGFASHPERRSQKGSWTISELRTPQELRIEGAILNHCVGSHEYVRDCKKGDISIWSLRKWTERSSHRVVTIEIDNQKRAIITALGKSNSDPSEQAWRLISQWADQESLKLHGAPSHLND